MGSKGSAEWCLRWLSSFLKALSEKMKRSVLFSEKYFVNNVEVWSFFPFFNDLQDELESSTPIQSSNTPNKPSQSTCWITTFRSRDPHIQRKSKTWVSRHFTPAVSVGFYLFKISLPQVIFPSLTFHLSCHLIYFPWLIRTSLQSSE